MAAAPATAGGTRTRETTLLELVQAVSAVAGSDAEVVATVLHLLRSGRVRLRGSFRGSLLDQH